MATTLTVAIVAALLVWQPAGYALAFAVVCKLNANQ